MKIVIVGRGLIGSAAARHLAEAGHEICLVGPSEPENFDSHDGTFASHYDEGRITRSLDPFRFWSKAATASIARYKEIERKSGVDFFSEVGVMLAGPSGSEPITNVEKLAIREKTNCRIFEDEGLAGTFPYFAFPEGTRALYEPDRSGHISPRSLARAQGLAAQAAGAVVIDATAEAISETDAGVTVKTEKGAVEGARVLVATGGFSRHLLEPPLPLKVYARTVAFFEVSGQQAAELTAMPSLIYLLPSGEDPYLLPPIRYPDGKFYLKLGGDPEDVLLADEPSTRAWFRSGGSGQVGDLLEDMIRERMPGLDIKARHVKPCVTTYTPDNIPLLSQHSGKVFAAVGGCGRAAKSSDEIGRLGGELLLGNSLPDWAYEAAV